jgi:hypothetical protein
MLVAAAALASTLTCIDFVMADVGGDVDLPMTALIR